MWVPWGQEHAHMCAHNIHTYTHTHTHVHIPTSQTKAISINTPGLKSLAKTNYLTVSICVHLAIYLHVVLWKTVIQGQLHQTHHKNFNDVISIKWSFFG